MKKTILSLAAFFVATLAFAQPEPSVEMSIDTLSGCAPLRVFFKFKSVNNTDTMTLFFGDGYQRMFKSRIDLNYPTTHVYQPGNYVPVVILSKWVTQKDSNGNEQRVKIEKRVVSTDTISAFKCQSSSDFKDSCEWSVSNCKFRTIGDTVKEGMTYMKVYRDMDDSAFSFDESRATLYALMRYDAPAKSLYGLDPADSVAKEFLMYDFSMKEGDTIDIVAYKRSLEGLNIPLKAICTGSGKDSVTLLDGEKRAVLQIQILNLDNTPNKLFKSKWMEGIGSDYGLFSPDYGSGYGCRIERNVLLCYAEKGETLLELPENDNDGQKGDCFNMDKGMKINNLKATIPVSVQPNPASSKINVECKAEIRVLSLYNTAGQRLRQISPDATHVVLPVTGLPCGLYLLKVETDKGTAVQKVVVE